MVSAPGRTVLVVEDDHVIREMLSEFLAIAGFAVVAAQDGVEAVQHIDRAAAAEQHLCLVLLDLMLPRRSGLAVLQHLRARLGTVPVVALSASRELLAQALQAGATRAVAKPFQVEGLLSLVAQHCPQHRG